MPGKTGKRSKAPGLCGGCGAPIKGDFFRTRKADYCDPCYTKKLKSEEVRRMIPVIAERWLDGVMADSQDVAGETPESLRDMWCPASKGWEHFNDEGALAARKDRAVYIFRQGK